MPLLNLKVSGDVPTSVAGELARALTDVTVNSLGKRRELTSVLVEFVPHWQWFVGNDLPRSHGYATFCLDIKITSGTNSMEEKATFQRAAFDAIATVLGNVHPTSYIIIHEVAADAWGFGGESQASRRHRNIKLISA